MSSPTAIQLDQIRKLSQVIYGNPDDALAEHGEPTTREQASDLLQELHRLRRYGAETPPADAGGPARRDETMPEEEPMPGTKTCVDCGETKPLDEYGKNKSTRDGHARYCKPCKSARNKAYNATRRKKTKKKEDSASVTNREKVKASVASTPTPDPQPDPDPPLSPAFNGDLRSLFSDPRLSTLEQLQKILSDLPADITLDTTADVARELVSAFAPKGGSE